MKNPVRTTITMPAELLDEARVVAAIQKTTISGLIRKLLEKQVVTKTGSKTRLELGKYSLNIKKSLDRKQIYEDYIKRKVPA